MSWLARALEPPAWQWAKNAVAASRAHGVRYRHYPAAHKARLHLLPVWIDLRAGLIVDLGANSGDWTAAALTAIPDAQVVTVEPYPPAYQRLVERFGTNSNVRLEACAIDATSGEAAFHVGAQDLFGSLLEFDPNMQRFYGDSAREAEEIKVRAMTLDDLVVGEPVSLLKMDVQGAELRVLAGGSLTLPATQAVLVESTLAEHYKGGSNFARVYDALTAEGFVVWDFAPPARSGGQALWMDVAYVRPQSAV